jgi:hypothetical protein
MNLGLQLSNFTWQDRGPGLAEAGAQTAIGYLVGVDTPGTLDVVGRDILPQVKAL